jgi:murein L,D-transpeptidase YcbB/YkuD
MLALLTWLLASFTPSPPSLRIAINIPAYRLEAFVGDSLVRTVAIAPGMPRYRTPRGSFAITRIEWNPWWIPPKSPWAAKEKITPPGPANPMGKVKLNFNELYFVHGSPFETSIGTAASHGCVRVKNADAIELARLVHQYGTPSVRDGEIDRFIADTATRDVAIEIPVPLEIRYDLVEIRGGRVHVYRDIYSLATRSMRDETFATLEANGVDTTRIDERGVRALVRSIPRAGRSTPLDSLIRSAGAGKTPTTPGRVPDSHRSAIVLR